MLGWGCQMPGAWPGVLQPLARPPQGATKEIERRNPMGEKVFRGSLPGICFLKRLAIHPKPPSIRRLVNTARCLAQKLQDIIEAAREGRERPERKMHEPQGCLSENRTKIKRSELKRIGLLGCGGRFGSGAREEVRKNLEVGWTKFRNVEKPEAIQASKHVGLRNASVFGCASRQPSPVCRNPLWKFHGFVLSTCFLFKCIPSTLWVVDGVSHQNWKLVRRSTTMIYTGIAWNARSPLTIQSVTQFIEGLTSPPLNVILLTKCWLLLGYWEQGTLSSHSRQKLHEPTFLWGSRPSKTCAARLWCGWALGAQQDCADLRVEGDQQGLHGWVGWACWRGWQKKKGGWNLQGFAVFEVLVDFESMKFLNVFFVFVVDLRSFWSTWGGVLWTACCILRLL